VIPVLALPVVLAAGPARSPKPVELMPIYQEVPVGGRATLTVKEKVMSYSMSGPDIVRIARITTLPGATRLVLLGVRRGSTAFLLVYEGNVWQTVSVRVR
jgi:hypothetical protein